MTVVADALFTDSGLQLFTGTQTFHILTSEAPDFAGIAIRTIGNAPVTIGAPAPRPGGGFHVTVPAITGGETTYPSAETATHYAIVTVDTLLVSSALDSSQLYPPGSTFSTNEFDLYFPAVA